MNETVNLTYRQARDQKLNEEIQHETIEVKKEEEESVKRSGAETNRRSKEPIGRIEENNHRRGLPSITRSGIRRRRESTAEESFGG